MLGVSTLISRARAARAAGRGVASPSPASHALIPRHLHSSSTSEALKLFPTTKSITPTYFTPPPARPPALLEAVEALFADLQTIVGEFQAAPEKVELANTAGTAPAVVSKVAAASSKSKAALARDEQE